MVTLPTKIADEELGIRAKEWKLMGGEFVQCEDTCAFLSKGTSRLGCFDRVYEKQGSDWRRVPTRKHQTSCSKRMCPLFNRCEAAEMAWGIPIGR